MPMFMLLPMTMRYRSESAYQAAAARVRMIDGWDRRPSVTVRMDQSARTIEVRGEGVPAPEMDSLQEILAALSLPLASGDEPLHTVAWYVGGASILDPRDPVGEIIEYRALAGRMEIRRAATLLRRDEVLLVTADGQARTEVVWDDDLEMLEFLNEPSQRYYEMRPELDPDEDEA